MNAFQYVLTAAQLTKHYEVVQFLTQHPNERYTLAQLDTLLPHGVAVQRFPEEWFDLIADGACWHRSIELQRPPPQLPEDVNSEEKPSASSLAVNESTSKGDTAASQRGDAVASVLESSAASARTQAARRLLYVLSCVRAEIRTLAELRSRLESPSTLLDAEGCVALHTDQILIDPRLILQAQRTGLVYYFPDTYDRNAYRRFGVKETTAGSPTGAEGSGGGGRGRAGQATSALLDTFASQEEAERTVPSSSSAGDSAGGRRDVTFLSLPSGVRVQHHLLTRRGVPEQEAHCIPTRLFVGERLRLIVDNATAVRELGADGDLRVDMVMRGVRPSKSDPTVVGPPGQQMFNALQTEPPPPLRIRKETQSVRHAVATAGAVSAGISGSGAPAPMQPPAPLLVSATTKVELEAMYPCTLTLVLTVNNVENVLSMEVMEETAAMPGVLILRDRQLDSFSLSQKDALPDVLVNPPVTAEYPFQSIDPGAPAATSAAWAELVPLPWTQNPSPAVLSLRDATYPAQHTTLQVATRAVFSAQSLADEARVRLTIARLRREAARKESAGGKRRVQRFRSDLVLSNRHLLHFGFNFSIPFMPPPQ